MRPALRILSCVTLLLVTSCASSIAPGRPGMRSISTRIGIRCASDLGDRRFDFLGRRKIRAQSLDEEA